MRTNLRSTPQFQFDGIKDVSLRPELIVPEARPQHLPHFFLWTQSGKLIPQIMSGGDATRTFGPKTFDLRSKFATHQTVFANTALQNSNVSMLQRLIPADAKRAGMRLWLMVEKKNNQPSYARDEDGEIYYDVNGDVVFNPVETLVDDEFDASGGSAPVAGSGTAGAIRKGDSWIASVGGSLFTGDLVLEVNDKLTALVNSPTTSSLYDVNGNLQWAVNTLQFESVSVNELTWFISPFYTVTETPGLPGQPSTFEYDDIPFSEAVPIEVVENSSFIYPIIDFMGEFGSAANLYGLSLTAPTLTSSIPINDDDVINNNAYVYRLTAKRKLEENVTAGIVPTVLGDTFIDFTLKKDTVDSTGINELFLETAYFKAFEDKNANPRKYADLDGIFVYSENLDEILPTLEVDERAGLLATGQFLTTASTYDVIPNEGANAINIFSGFNHKDFKYETIRVLPSNQQMDEYVGGHESTQLRSSVTHYLKGGADGTLSAANFESAVQAVFYNYSDYVIPFLSNSEPDSRDVVVDFTDIARWPQSAYWDSGFTDETKPLLSFALERPNVYIVWASHGSNGEVQLLNSEEGPAADILVSAARMHPESELYGTGCCRALVCLQSGKLLNSPWKKVVPVSLDLLDVISKYMGASDGNWKTEFRFDIGDGKIVSMFDVDTVNHDKNLAARAQDWQRSTVYVQSYDRNRLMRPGVQTVYGNPTSVLNSFLTVAAACEITTLCHQTWAEFTGVQTIQGLELLEEIDKSLTEKLSGGKFDGVVTVEVNSTYTARDLNDGYSWTTNVILRGPNMKTVGNFNVTSDRLEEPNNV